MMRKEEKNMYGIKSMQRRCYNYQYSAQIEYTKEMIASGQLE